MWNSRPDCVLCPSRRTFNEQLLHIIKDEGSFSTMHTLLVYLQTADQDEIPVVAGLLLQLDLLVRTSQNLIGKKFYFYF